MSSSAFPYMPTKTTQDGILQFTKQASMLVNQQLDIRQHLEHNDRQYQREVDRTIEQAKALRANRLGDPTKFQNIVVPVILPQVENATSYQASVFLQGNPIFGTVSGPKFADQALQMDTIIGDQQVRGNWVQNFIQAFRDGFKHNLMALECDWARIKSFAPDSKKEQEIIYEGNSIKRMDLYNTFWDTRVFPDQVSKYGEFAGYNELMGRIRLKQFINNLPYNINIKEAFESGAGDVVVAGVGGYDNYYLPTINPDAFIDQKTWQGTDWMAWAGLETRSGGGQINYKNCYVVKTLYARILPSEFAMKNVPGQNTPQVWKFIIVNNQVIIYAERLTNAHGLIPILFAQPLNDGLGYQTKSFSQNLEPIQQITTAIANSDIHSRRRAVSDRVIYDSSRISAAAINNDNPMAKIPARPSAAGQAIGSAVYQFPFNDNLFQINQAALQTYEQMGNQVSGYNPVKQGQFVKGNKTRREFDSVMANANGRDQLVAMSIEADLMTPIKEIIKLNILQYQGGTTLLNRTNNQPISIDPIALRQAQLVFKISDGLIPSDQIIGADVFQVALQTALQVPAIGQGYNTAQMFGYLLKSQGADVRPFEKSPQQLAYENAMGQWQQAVQQITEMIMSRKDVQIEQIQQLIKQMIPPQPQPQQFNYTPGEVNQPDSTQPGAPTLLQQTLAISNGQGSAAQQGNGATQPTSQAAPVQPS